MCTPETLRYSGYMLGSDGIPVDPLKPCAAPGQHKVSGGPLGFHQNQAYIRNIVRFQGYTFCNCTFISYIINESMQNT